MSTQVDLPVRVDGKLYRFIANGDVAALFAKGSKVENLVVTEPAQGRKMPKVTNANGDPVQMLRASRPCSCKGEPWSSSYRMLSDSLVH